MFKRCQVCRLLLWFKKKCRFLFAYSLMVHYSTSPPGLKQRLDQPHTCHVLYQAFNYISKKYFEGISIQFLGEIFDNIRERSRQKCLQRAFESYIHNIICRQSIVNEELIKREGKAHSSHKHQALHALTFHTKDKHTTV